jgi:putative inorganic carbon (HCO3(-)) transporter
MRGPVPIPVRRHWATLEVVWLLCLAPFLLLPGRFLPVSYQWLAVMAAFLFWPIRKAISGRFSISTPINLCVLLILLWLPVTIWASVDRARSWEVAGYLVFGITLGMALVNWTSTQRQPERIAWVLLALGTLLLLLGPLLIVDHGASFAPLASLQRLGEPVARRLGETMNPNVLAGALAVIFPLALALSLRWDWTSRRWLSTLSGLLAIGIVAIIVVTASRGSLLAIAAAVPLLLILRWPRLLFLAPVLLLGAIVLFYLHGPTLLDQLAAGPATSGFAERVEIWQRALYAMQDFPFTGIGLGTFDRVIPLLYPYFLISPAVDIPHAHNLPLQVGVDLGVPGLIAYAALVICLFVMLISPLRRRALALHWTLAAGALGALVAILVGGIFDVANWGVKLAFVDWLLIAMVVVLHRCAQEPSDTSLAREKSPV